jgi:hypothetical protein
MKEAELVGNTHTSICITFDGRFQVFNGFEVVT